MTLSTGDVRVVEATVSELSGAIASRLFEALVERLTACPFTAHPLRPWLVALLHSHGIFLASFPAARLLLDQLYGMVARRTTTQPALCRLQGHVDGLLLRARKAGSTATPSLTTGLSTNPAPYPRGNDSNLERGQGYADWLLANSDASVPLVEHVA
eukprot:GHVT01104908.1.p1 GENE.GHVT01104908.1~~GHVT01104908.1.p1  ORF type:complete len:156 (+),score=35.14 GHVT01104908.1:1307-1774(+)